MSLKSKLVLLIFFISIIPPLLATGIGYHFSKKALKESTLTNLHAISEFREGQVFLFLDKLKSKTELFASDFFIKTITKKIVNNKNKGASKETKDYKDELLEKKKYDKYINSINIFNLDGKIVFSTETHEAETDISNQSIFSKMHEKKFFIIEGKPSQKNEIVLIAAAPIFDPDKSSSITAFLMIHYNSSIIQDLLSGKHVLNLGAKTQIRGIGKTGETYLVNYNKLMITDSLFIKKSRYELTVNTKPVKQCIERHKENTGLWLDYRGVPVVGASMCINYSGLNWIILVEQDEKEAFLPIQKLRNYLLSLGFFIQLFIVALTLLLSKKLIQPLKKLELYFRRVDEGHYNEDLETVNRGDEIGDMSRTLYNTTEHLVQALEKIKKQDQRKSDFVGNVSHEFKSPLATITMSLDNLKSSLDPNNAMSFKMLEISQRNTRRLIRLVTDLLDVSKIEAGNLELKKQKFDIVRLVQELLEDLQADIAEKSFDISFSCEQKQIEFLGDLDKLRRVLINLIRNAIKYTPENGIINLKLKSEPAEVIFEISNTGPGIPEDFYEKIFDKFERIKAEKQEGSGLGLPIAKGIVVLHGGTIQVKSLLGEITTFTVTLPKNTPIKPLI
jgi:signal transduction histidine kinase